MSKEYQTIGMNSRFLSRIQYRGTRGEAVKSLAELIKNADDAYERMHMPPAVGNIDIGYWRLKRKPNRAVGFFIRDYGSGMDMQQIQSAYGVDGYGADTSSNVRNGAIGVGGKDALSGMDNCKIITIKNAHIIAISIITNNVGLLQSSIRENDDALKMLEDVNELLPKNSRLNPKQDGTFVMFHFPKSHQGKSIEGIKDHLRVFYTLRTIFSDNKRLIKFIDLSNYSNEQLQYLSPKGTVLTKESFDLFHNNNHYKCDVEIKKADKPSPYNNRDYGERILIKTDRGGILDNTLFGRDNDPASQTIFGEVVIHDWNTLYEDDGTIMTDHRDGLDPDNNFNKKLHKRMLQILNPIIERENQLRDPNPELDNKLDDNINQTLNYINKLMGKNPQHIPEEIDDRRLPPTRGLEFSPSSLSLTSKQSKTVKLFFNPSQIASDDILSIQVLGDGITCDPSNEITFRKPNGDRNTPYIIFTLSGIENSHNKLNVFTNEYKASITVNVVSTDEIYPEHGFAFTLKHATFKKNTNKTLGLLIDTNIISPGTEISIMTNEDRLEIFPKKLTVPKPAKGIFLVNDTITLTSKKSGIEAELNAQTKTTLKENRDATAVINIIDDEPRNKFFTGYELSPSSPEEERFSFNDGKVLIHTSAPVLKHYFGYDCKLLKTEKMPDAICILADTILQCVTYEWAKNQIKTKKVDMISDNETDEINRLKHILEKEYGVQLHKMLTRGIKNNAESNS